MKPPIFLWMSGALDGFDTVEEFESRYPPEALAGKDFIACDSEGRILRAGRGSDGVTVLACDEKQPPSPETLRKILGEYLERRGMPREEINSLSLAELVATAYPAPDPRLEQMKYKAILYYVILPPVFVVCYVVYKLVSWLMSQ